MLPRPNPIDKVDAIQSLRPGAAWILKGDSELEWLDTETEAPTDEEILFEMARLQQEWNDMEYARLRKAEYDQLNQYEMMYDDQVNGTTTWVDAINAIKAKYPKP